MASQVSNLIQAKETARPQGGAYGVGQYLELERIRTDGGTQARAGLDDATVRDYAETWLALSHRQNGFLEMPPIVVYHDGTDYWLADGFHRVEAYKRFVNGPSASASPRAIRAVVQQGTRRDAVLFACGANDTHGLRRTQADKRRAIETVLRDDEWRQWSDSEIARRCNVDHKTVGSMRATLYPGNSQDSRTVERNGTTYQQKPPARPADELLIVHDNRLLAEAGAINMAGHYSETGRIKIFHYADRRWVCMGTVSKGDAILSVEGIEAVTIADYPGSPLPWKKNGRNGAGTIAIYNGERLVLTDRRIRVLPAADPQPPASGEPFWQATYPNHPTAHLWTRERPDLLRSACGQTIQNRLPSGSTEAGHCSSCVRATWPQNQAAPAEPTIPEAPNLADILLRLDAHGYAKIGTRQKGITTFYSFRDFRSTLDDGQAGELELAEGELPLWLAELDSNAAYAQAKQEKYSREQGRAEQLGYDLRRDGAQFLLTPAGQKVPAMRGTLDQLIKVLDGYEKNAAKQAVAEPTLTIEQLDDCLPKGYEKLGYFWVTAAPPTLGHIDGWRGDAPTIAGAIAQAADREKARAAAPASGDQASRLTAAIDLMESIIGENPRGAAVVLLGALAKAMKGVRAEDLESLSQAISDLNECQEGTEAAYWLTVGYALLDLEKD